MALPVNLTGYRVGSLTVLKPTGKCVHNGRLWECRCDCGNTTIVAVGHLRGERPTKSCGCQRWNKRHGLARTRVYIIWQQMRARCSRPSATGYSNYGGRGISVCQRWNDAQNFVRDMGEPPSINHTLERRDNNADYSPENCYWATRSEQQRNRRTNRLITAFGQTRTLVEWVEISGISTNTLKGRLDSGWQPEHAVTFPPSQAKYKVLTRT